MPTERGNCPMDDPLIQELFQKEYIGLLKTARGAFRRYGGNIDPDGRAEEIVQETFYLAIEKREELLSREDKKKWLISAVCYKAREAAREDRKWEKGLLLLPHENEEVPLTEPDEILESIPKEDGVLLRRLYVEGYTYKELCAELGIGKSNLGMKVNRIKKVIKKKYGNYFI